MTTRQDDRGRAVGPRRAVPAPARRRRRPSGPGFTIITGLSGAGRSEAARCLEDLGYFVVDNLPPSLLAKMAELAAKPGGPGKVAIVLDVRGGVFFGELSRALQELEELNIAFRILYLEASDQDLVNRYEAT
ncbi:MAG: RNase adapter RapZ, partial [Actinomycetota bacterium]